VTVPTPRFDIAIIGAGMAGASLAWFVAQYRGGSVVVLEAEHAPGYHTTGRSAAFWEPTYGGAGVVPLSTASRAFFDTPPPGFAERPLLSPRGALHVAAPGNDGALAALAADFAGFGVATEALDAAAMRARFGFVGGGWEHAGLLEPDCHDIDVAGLHAGFLTGAKRAGATLMVNARVTGMTYDPAGGEWHLATTAGDVAACVVVDAAGAWGDELAALAGARPIGLTPLRRTMVVLDTDPAPPADLPVVFDAGGSFYFKPDAGRLWLSPHDEIADVPRDAAPEELDIAVAIDRFEAATTARVRRVERSWAGLRTFSPDRNPVYGHDPHVPGFFWCVGQGGFGIQTAPAAGDLAARLLLGMDAGAVDPAPYAPGRFG
jgi:D-arginine dehydrogenase